jgi:hypothetical protein
MRHLDIRGTMVALDRKILQASSCARQDLAWTGCHLYILAITHADATLDRGVWNAYGWSEVEVPARVEEDVILSRLLDLNQKRSVNEITAED